MNHRNSCLALLFMLLSTPLQAQQVLTATFGQLDYQQALSELPETSDKPVQEARLLDNTAIGARVFRVYHPVPQHYHQFSDTYLVVVSGAAEFLIDGKQSMTAQGGDIVFWQRGINHQVVKILEAPFDVIAIDLPTRQHDDIVFTHKDAEGSFIGTDAR